MDKNSKDTVTKYTVTIERVEDTNKVEDQAKLTIWTNPSIISKDTKPVFYIKYARYSEAELVAFGLVTEAAVESFLKTMKQINPAQNRNGIYIRDSYVDSLE